MLTGFSKALIAAVAGLSAIHATDIEGTVVIKRKLSKRVVTASAGAYQRGAAVELGAEELDALGFERTHVVVYIEGQFPPRPITARMEQKNRRFVPDILAVPLGSTVSFPNMDAIFHNVFSLSKPKSFDLGNYSKDQTRAVTFRTPGIVFVNCHLHPNMTAVIFVAPSPWTTTPDASGKFALSEVPAGTHTLVAWHQNAGFFRQTVRVGDYGIADAQFFIPFEALGAAGTIASR